MSFFKDFEHEWVQKQEFEKVETTQLLAIAAQEIQEAPKNKPLAWVFDLDSTLFCTGPRNKRVFWKFLQKQENFPKHWMLAWNQLSPQSQEYGVPKTFFKLFREQGWSEAEAQNEARHLWESYREHWMEEFFLSSNMAYDPPYEGAVKFVQSLYDLGYDVVYLTGRDEPRALEGTIHALKAANFPMGDRTHVRLKPSQDMADLDFKTRAAERLNSEFSVRALMDNEPENLVMFAEFFEFAHIVFFHSIMSPRVPDTDIRKPLGQRRLYLLDHF